jgi:hypothetical protein
MGKGGNYVEYYVFMLEEWGQIMIDEFRDLKNKTVIYKIHDFHRIQEEYEEKTKELLDNYRKLMLG